jgi:hypothetical protein
MSTKTYVVSQDGTVIGPNEYCLVDLTEEQADRLLDDYGDSDRFTQAVVYNMRNAVDKYIETCHQLGVDFADEVVAPPSLALVPDSAS